MVMEAKWHTGRGLCWTFCERGASSPQTLGPELAIWKLPCLKAPIRRLRSVSAARKARLWLMQFHARQWSLQLNLCWVPHMKKAGKRQTAAAADQRQIEGKRACTQRCYTTPDQIIELHLQYYHCRLTFLCACEITHERLLPCNTMRHTRPILWIEKPRIKRQLFLIIQFWWEVSWVSCSWLQ